MRSLGLSIYQLGLVSPTTNFQLLSIFNQRIVQPHRNNMPIAAISTICNGDNGVEETTTTSAAQQQRNEIAAAVINNELDLYKVSFI